MLRVVRRGGLAWLLAGTLAAGACTPFPAAAELPHATRARCVTNIVQFRSLSGEDFLSESAFELSGVVTLVDTNRHLIVLQDSTDSVALHVAENHSLVAGESVSLAGSNCWPLFTLFPDYPHRPASWDLRNSFEAPSGLGNYYLTRMRGWLHPPASGQYTFWIASDNSSELWLSPDASPASAKKIAFIPRYDWVAPREWSKFPSQRSESVWLNAGQSYYIEALQEQTTGEEHLAVAWQGPGIAQSVITSEYLTPWNHGRYATLATTNGVLREYWTNFSSGELTGVRSPRPFESVLSVEQLRVLRREAGPPPKPVRVSFDPRWLSANNYRWVEAAGVITFTSEDGDNAFLELADGKAQLQLRTTASHHGFLRLARNVPVCVRGVCEGIFDDKGTVVPGWIWIATTNDITVIETARRKAPVSAARSNESSPPGQPLSGFYGMRGVVTFHGRALGKEYLFVQEGSTALAVSLKDCAVKTQVKVGQWIDLGGAIKAGKSLPIMAPLYMKELGWRSMPAPVTEPIHVPIPEHRDGQWTEFEGIVHSVNSNGTLSVMGAKGAVAVWLAGARDEPSRYVDAKLRVRGVLSLSAFEQPVLLVPSRSFVEVAAPAPANAFELPIRAIAQLPSEGSDPSSLHRVRLAGHVTLLDAESFFLQDATGGARVRTFTKPPVNIGDSVEVIGFPAASETRTLTNVLVRTAAANHRAEPAKLDLTDTLHARQNGVLVHVEAELLAQRIVGHSHILELRERQRIFTATLPARDGSLAAIARGSRVGITGVCDSDRSVLPAGLSVQEQAVLGLLNIWLRTPADVKVLSGPPWWTWQRVSALIGALLTICSGALLWVHLLRRRLEREKAAQFAASQQILKQLEEERRRIAANLHDSLGQVLLAIKNQSLLALQRPSGEAVVRERLNEISGATSQALEEVRQITHGLRPYQLDRLGLTQALRDTVSRASANSAILFASRVEDIDTVFDKDSEIHVYRIVQEATNNVLKHSAANEAAVVIRKRNDRVSLSIRDNGRGFDVAAMRTSQSNALGYGLSGIAERVRILGGELTIDSRPGGGTSLNVEIPVSQTCLSR